MHRVVDRKWLFLGIYAGVFAILVLLFFRLPTGFLPDRGSGRGAGPVPAPRGRDDDPHAPGAEAGRELFPARPTRRSNVKTYFTVAGGGQGAAGQNTGQAFINLADYDKRKGSNNSADAIVQRASAAFRGLRDAQVFALVPGAIRGLGQSSGFTMELLNTGGMTTAAVR